MSTSTSSRKPKPPLGELIDALFKARKKRLDLDKKVEELKSEERVAKSALIERLSEAGVSSAAGSFATASIQKKRHVKIADWAKYWGWAQKDKGGNYVQKRIATEALSEYLSLNPKKVVPGVEFYEDYDVSLTKVSGKKTTKRVTS